MGGTRCARKDINNTKKYTVMIKEYRSLCKEVLECNTIWKNNINRNVIDFDFTVF